MTTKLRSDKTFLIYVFLLMYKETYLISKWANRFLLIVHAPKGFVKTQQIT